MDCPTPEAKYRSIANIYGVITIGQVWNQKPKTNMESSPSPSPSTKNPKPKTDMESSPSVRCGNKNYLIINDSWSLSLQAMIFCHTRKTVNWLVEKMTAEGHAVALLSGELTVEERLIVLDR